MSIDEKLSGITEELAKEIGADVDRFRAIMSRGKHIIVIVETDDQTTFIETNVDSPLKALEMLIGVTDYLFGEINGAVDREESKGDIDSESGGSDPLDKGTIN